MVEHLGPSGPALGTEVDVLTFELIDAARSAIVDDEVAAVEVLMVAQDQPLVRRIIGFATEVAR